MNSGKFQEASAAQTPNMLVIEGLGIDLVSAQLAAQYAENLARLSAPKLSGASSSRIEAAWDVGWFGLTWQDNYVWYQNVGTNPFTMHKLAGKMIPMWVNDADGKERQKNPKAKSRVTADGRTQVLIFRRAAKHGQRKTVRRRQGLVSVPMSYPGAPGRIARREQQRPFTTPGKVAGQIASRNVGVRWRHPGLGAKGWLEAALISAARIHGYSHYPVIPAMAAA